MRERRDVEIGAKLAIDSYEEVEIEGRGHAERVVVGQLQHRRRLHQIGAEQEQIPRSQGGANVGQQLVGARRIEITDVRSQEER